MKPYSQKNASSPNFIFFSSKLQQVYKHRKKHGDNLLEIYQLT